VGDTVVAAGQHWEIVGFENGGKIALIDPTGTNRLGKSRAPIEWLKHRGKAYWDPDDIGITFAEAQEATVKRVRERSGNKDGGPLWEVAWDHPSYRGDEKMREFTSRAAADAFIQKLLKRRQPNLHIWLRTDVSEGKRWPFRDWKTVKLTPNRRRRSTK
jgi:hypothetical protein